MTPATSSAEIMRRIDDIVSRLDRITESLEQGYLRKDVYAADRTADTLQWKALEDGLHLIGKRVDNWEDRARRAASARWSILASALVGPILVVLILHAMGLISAVHK